MNQELTENFTFSDSIDAVTIPFDHVLYTCPVLPPIKNLQEINVGADSYADTLFGYDFVVYDTNSAPDQVIGNFAPAGTFNWNPTTGQNSNEVPFIVKDTPGDCVFNPVVQYYYGKFGAAWLENNEYGRLDLKYGDTPVTMNPPMPPGYVAPNGGILYTRPFVNETLPELYQSNIPLSTVYVKDIMNNTFDLSPYEYTKNGFNLVLPTIANLIRFTQSFVIPNASIEGYVTTVPTQTYATGWVNPVPIAGITVNIYWGKNAQRIISTSVTDEYGKFTQTLTHVGEYMFEIIISGSNILYQQVIL
jgi:hypothetical protein